MNKQTREIIKIVVGILLGTVAVMSAIGFMLSLALHPLIIPILMMLFMVCLVIAMVMMGYKGIIVAIASFVFGWFGFNAYYHHACGPNSSDVKVMKPMAEKISAYIVKNGIPESLKDIPDLPYGLEGCEREVKYSKFNSNELIDEKVDSKEKADFYNMNEDCNFSYKKRIYSIELDKGWSRNIEDISRGSVDIGNKQSHTWASLGFDLNSIGEVKIRYGFSFASSKTDGICKSWRQ